MSGEKNLMQEMRGYRYLDFPPICPLNGQPCRGITCGWWCKRAGKCSIAVIADELGGNVWRR